MYTHGSGIRVRWKRWFLAVAGSRTGHPLQGVVHGGMILAVFTCRGRPAALNRVFIYLPHPTPTNPGWTKMEACRGNPNRCRFLKVPIRNDGPTTP